MRSDDLALVVCRPVAPGTSPTGRTGCPPVATAVRGGPDHETAAAQVNYLAALAEPPHEAILAKAKAKTLDRRITYWNAAAQRLHGHPPQQAIGSHGSLLAPPEREGEIGELPDRLSRGAKTGHCGTIRVTSTGVRLDVDVTLSSTRTSDGRTGSSSSVEAGLTDRPRSSLRTTERDRLGWSVLRRGAQKRGAGCLCRSCSPA
ncbi:PAS domain-containing protein [Streptomyces sp. NPDC045369]|uniref:PAS domain-containing protein n=1 Tax=Streptomyces sp. NPDC045369 TaxID=3155732 RepID=UPI0033C3A96B